jgi:hypothetical protein
VEKPNFAKKKIDKKKQKKNFDQKNKKYFLTKRKFGRKKNLPLTSTFDL